MLQISFKCLDFTVKYVARSAMLEMLHRKSITATNIDCMLQKSFKVVLKDVSEGLKMTPHPRLKDAECQFDGIVVRRVRREVLDETAFDLYSLNNARIDMNADVVQNNDTTLPGILVAKG